MADTKSKKRHFKNPETFRERAVQASEERTKAKHFGRARGYMGEMVADLTSPFRKVLAAFRRTLIGRIIWMPFHWLGLILLPVYVRRSWKELRQVTWPKWRESLRLTSAVLIFAIIFGALIAGVDYGLDKVFKHILLK